MVPQQAVAIYNPMDPKEDVDEEYAWRAVAVPCPGNQGTVAMQGVLDSMHKDKFDYTSTVFNGTNHPPTYGPILHLFRRKRSTMVDRDNHLEKVRVQIEALQLKIDSDKLQLEIAKMVKERTAALKVLSESGLSLVDQ
jgi:hypothetical protein